MPETDVGQVLTGLSQDGKTLLYFADSGDPKTNVDIFTLELTGDAMPVPVTHGPGTEGEGRFSPDGHWIAYAASTETESAGEVFVEPFPPTGRPSGRSHPAAVASQSGDRMERSSSSSTGISSLLWAFARHRRLSLARRIYVRCAGEAVRRAQ